MVGTLPDLDPDIPSGIGDVSDRVRAAVPDLSGRLALGTIATVILGPAALVVSYLLFVLANGLSMGPMSSPPSGLPSSFFDM